MRGEKLGALAGVPFAVKNLFDIAGLVTRLPGARLVDPFLQDFATAGVKVSTYLGAGDDLAGRHEALSARIEEGRSSLGRLKGPAA